MKASVKILSANQIGGCSVIIGSQNTKVVLDFGEPLPVTQTARRAQIDWATENISAVFFSHYHNDHIGRLAEIPKSIPLYMGRVTYEVYKNFCKKAGNLPALTALKRRKIRFFEDGQTVLTGDIEITPYSTDHSAVDAYMFLVKACDEYILYTGDYRDHGYKKENVLDILRRDVTENGKRHITALICEGTQLSRNPGEKYSEKQLYYDAVNYFKNNKYVFLKLPATNADSLATFANAAKSNGIKMYVNRYLYGQIKIFRKVGASRKTNIYAFNNVELLKPNNKAQEREMRAHGFVIIADGLYELLLNKFDDLPLNGIYSMWQGYVNQNSHAYNKAAGKFCKKLNADFLHTSGHAHPRLIEQVVNTVKPTEAIFPIHTEAPEEFYNLNINENLKKKIIISQ